MTIEFQARGRIYQCTVAGEQPPPAHITIPFQPCILRPAYQLLLAWVTTDEFRGIELYKPIEEVRS